MATGAAPNILFVLPDQVRACELGFAGGRNVPTRHIDRLAAGGAVFTNALFAPVDHFPTLAALRGMRVPSSLDGLNHAAELTGEKGPRPDALLMAKHSSSWDFPETMTSRREWRAVRTAQYTYIRWLNQAEKFYDNLADPWQTHNLWTGRKAPGGEGEAARAIAGPAGGVA